MTTTDKYVYLRNRMIRSGGRIIEQDLAPLEFKRADVLNAREELRKAQSRRNTRAVREAELWLARAIEEHRQFAVWCGEQTAAGRPESELRFGVFIRESGMWHPDPPPRAA